MSLITQAIEKMINYRGLFSFQEGNLASPLGVEEITAVLEGFPFQLSTELLEFYKYSPCGIDIDAGLTFFLPLEKALDLWLNTMIHNYIPNDVCFEINPSYLQYYKGCFETRLYRDILSFYPHDYCELPVIRGYGKEIYHFVCKQETSPISPVWVKPQGEAAIKYANSLTDLLLTTAECYEIGAYYEVFYEEYGGWEIESDLDKVESIFNKYNPEYIDVWRSLFGRI